MTLQNLHPSVLLHPMIKHHCLRICAKSSKDFTPSNPERSLLPFSILSSYRTVKDAELLVYLVDDT
jgi:hypothetical protein